MPAVSSVARCEPLLPGTAKFTLDRFNALQVLGPDYSRGIDLIVVRKNEVHLDSWVSPNQDGFITILPKNPRQRAQDFEFEVGPEVVNPMAFDNTGDYTLRIRDKNGIIISFSLGMKGLPRPDTTYVPKTQATPEPPKGVAGGYEPPRSNTFNTQADAGFANPNMGMGTTGMGATGAAGATASSGIGSLIVKIIGVLLILGLIGAGVSYFMGMWSLPGGSTTMQQEQKAEEPLALTEEDKQSVKEEQEQTAQEAAPAPASQASSPCSLAANSGDPQEILRNCLNSNPDVMQLDSFLKEALKTGQCEIATKLLSSKSRSAGGGKYAYLYAVLSNPNSTLSSSCVKKDAQEAEYWMNHAKRDQSFTEAEGQKLVNFFQQ